MESNIFTELEVATKVLNNLRKTFNQAMERSIKILSEGEIKTFRELSIQRQKAIIFCLFHRQNPARCLTMIEKEFLYSISGETYLCFLKKEIPELIQKAYFKKEIKKIWIAKVMNQATEVSFEDFFANYNIEEFLKKCDKVNPGRKYSRKDFYIYKINKN